MTAKIFSSSQRRDICQQLYDAGAEISDEIDVALADAVYSRPPDGLLATFHSPSPNERRRVTNAVMRELAGLHDVDESALRLAFRYHSAVDRIGTAVGRQRSDTLSALQLLSPRQVIQLARLSPKRIAVELEKLEDRQQDSMTRRER